MKRVLAASASLLVVLSIRPVFVCVFTGKVVEFAAFFRILSWFTVIPLVAVAFSEEANIYRIRRSGIVAFFMIVFGLVIGNVAQIGKLAYGVGPLYLGYFRDEAPLAIALAMFLPLFYLPEKGLNEAVSIPKSALFLSMLTLAILMLVMKRASIAQFLIGLFMVNVMLRRGVWAGRNSVILVGGLTVCAILVVTAVCYLGGLAEPLSQRFPEIDKFRKTGKISTLASGRLGVHEYYLRRFSEQSILTMMIGLDPTGAVDEEHSGYLYMYGDVPHNDYLDLLIRNGLLGLGAFAAFLATVVSTLKRVRAATRENPVAAQLMAATATSLVIYAISSFVDNTFGRVLPMTVFAYLLGGLCGLAGGGEIVTPVPKDHKARVGIKY
ncbi:MAG: O-antigen ligase family protein [Thermodesulfobacteriota bacterium]|nr:O-antigen ligase family protein [Thermodesulfobacteriota bacterium]